MKNIKLATDGDTSAKGLAGFVTTKMFGKKKKGKKAKKC